MEFYDCENQLENKKFYEYNIDDFEIVGTEGITKINSKLELAI